MRLYFCAIALFLLAGCAAKPPITLEGTDLELQPQQVFDSFTTVRGNRVAWGGVIVAAQNLTDHTRIEMLAYPLNEWTRPQTNADAQGRFVIHHEGYLETVDYAPGRELTVAGTLTEIETGKVGEAEYEYPVVHAQELHLWKPEVPTKGFFSFGFGIVIKN